MSQDSGVTFNTKELNKLIKAFDKIPVARVGVLGAKNARSGSGEKTNAEIGAKHEFGFSGMPIRSFLRVPVTDNLNKYLEKSDAFDEDTIERVIREGSIAKWIGLVAITAVSIVLDGFDTGGFGKWKPSIMARKKNKQTLVETTQLRDSITWDMK